MAGYKEMKVYTKNSGEVLKDSKHGSNNIRFWLEKNYAVEKLGKEVRSPETEDHLEFRVDIGAGSDDGLDWGVFTLSAAQPLRVIGSPECDCDSRSRAHWSESLDEEEVKKAWEQGESTTWTQSSLS